MLSWFCNLHQPSCWLCTHACGICRKNINRNNFISSFFFIKFSIVSETLLTKHRTLKFSNVMYSGLRRLRPRLGFNWFVRNQEIIPLLDCLPVFQNEGKVFLQSVRPPAGQFHPLKDWHLQKVLCFYVVSSVF